jgi:hypothetical protein
MLAASCALIIPAIASAQLLTSAGASESEGGHVSFMASADHGAETGGPRRRAQGGAPRRAGIRLGVCMSGALAATAVLALATPAGAGTSSTGTSSAGTSSAGTTDSAAARGPAVVVRLAMRAMPAGTVTFGRGSHRRLTVAADMSGLTPGSSHDVDLVIPGRSRAIRVGTLTANGVGQADSILQSSFTGRFPHGSRLLIRMGTRRGPVAREPIAITRRLSRPGRRPHRLISVEVSTGGISYGTPRGRAIIVYTVRRHTLTIAVSASGLTPGPHAAHIHLGSCVSQGPVKYMLRDLVANRRGRIARAIRIITNVTTPIPAHGWYLNVHQGNSRDILRNGQPTIFFRPLICADINGATRA